MNIPHPLILKISQSIISKSDNYYKVVKKLGSGKNASAYLVLKTSGNSRGTFYVMKILNNPADAVKLKRFSDEVEVLLNIQHNSIVRIFDEGIFRTKALNFPFYICDYFNDSLEMVIKNGKASTKEKLGYAVQLCSALEHLSSQNVIHCDIKPDNIYVDGAKCVIGDFGLITTPTADFNESSLPSLHKYRSPDIVDVLKKRKQQLTPKSDVFLLGLALSELFTGINPCQESASGLDEVVIDKIPTLPHDIGYRISRAIASMLELDSDKRKHAGLWLDIWQGMYFDEQMYSDNEPTQA
jgi:serine/threonine protein kinase